VASKGFGGFDPVRLDHGAAVVVPPIPAAGRVHEDGMPVDVRSVLLDQELLVSARPATHVACDACYDGHIEEVTPIKDRKGAVSFRIYCCEAGWVDVPENRLRQWTVDLRRLVAVLSAAVGTGQSPDELIRESAWRLGTIGIAGESYDVVFVRTGGPAHEPALDELARKHPAARTIVVPSRDLPESSNGFAAALPLATAFLFTGGRVALQLARVRSILSVDSPGAASVFRRQGDKWVVSFEGKTIYPRESVGLIYIARLLAEPHRDIPAVTLLATRAGIDPRIALGSSGPVLPEETRANYMQRYQELQADLHRAAENNDIGRVEKLEFEMEHLASELASATGLGGRAREKSDIERVRKSVSMAVSRAITAIGKRHKLLAHHLTVSIMSDLTFRYAPEREVEWLV
jgi:hypothetical protein